MVLGTWYILVLHTMYIHNEIVGYPAFDMTETLEEDIRLRTYDLPLSFCFLDCVIVSHFSHPFSDPCQL